MKKRIFIGAAWPYANNSLHLGHAVALIGADILARYYRAKGSRVLFVSGSDCHGTPIAVEAEKRGILPLEVAKKYHQEFIEILINKLGFSYDFYSQTTSSVHKKVVQDIFLDLYKKGYIYKKTQELPYCSKCDRFLPDRYVEGVCPHCGYPEARGDQCDECGKLISPKDLKDIKCKICGSTPIWRESEHFFFKLSAFSSKLKDWIKKQDTWRNNAKNFSLKFIEGGLKDRAITRDINWGVEIPLPGYAKKRIYVWFEAVCGYLSASKEWSKQTEDWKDFWEKDCYHYYVHGKDNIPFHTIIWPAILLGLGKLNLPNQIVSSEYLQLEGKQFSKSRKWAVWLPDVLSAFSPESLRYYLVAAGPETADANFSWKDFQLRNNSEMVGTFGNFIHRVLSFTYRNFDGKLPDVKIDSDGEKLIQSVEDSFGEIGLLIEKAEFKKALKSVFNLAEQGNRFLDKKEPWKEIKKDKDKAGSALLACIQVINNLRILIHPFLPKTSAKIGLLLNQEKIDWQFQTLKQQSIKEPKPLFSLIDDESIEKEKKRLIG